MQIVDPDCKKPGAIVPLRDHLRRAKAGQKWLLWSDALGAWVANGGRPEDFSRIIATAKRFDADEARHVRDVANEALAERGEPPLVIVLAPECAAPEQ